MVKYTVSTLRLEPKVKTIMVGKDDTQTEIEILPSRRGRNVPQLLLIYVVYNW